ncbi:MAG: hypothetical protein AAGF75_01980, partial [Cyanobacteria bacterium P01_H01_bin.130]
GLVIALGVLSVLPLHRLSWVLRGLLLVSLLALGTALLRLGGLPHYIQAPTTFVEALGTSVSWGETLGVFLTATMTVPIDMKFQQFVVQGRSPRVVTWGCVLATIIVLLLAAVPSVAVAAAQESGILPDAIAPREIIPYVLAWLGGGLNHPLGIVLVGTLLVPALGAGSTVLRIQSQLVMDSLPLPVQDQGATLRWRGGLIRLVNAGLALMLALKGGSIIGSMVLFYAVNGAVIWWPFMAYLLDRCGLLQLSPLAVQLSAGMAAIASLGTLVLTQWEPAIALAGSAELTVLAMGLGFGAIALGAGQLITLWRPRAQQMQI